MSEQLPSHFAVGTRFGGRARIVTRFGLRAMKPESSHLPAPAPRFGPLRKADVPEANPFSAIAETTK
jgi:hypothetical protein